jgi:hypothetical protein
MFAQRPSAIKLAKPNTAAAASHAVKKCVRLFWRQ